MPGLKKRGFTIIEIMMVLAIIALLTAVVVPNILAARMGANEMATRALLKNFASAGESYKTINLDYPEQMSYLTGGSSPYFTYDLSAPKDGYNYASLLSTDGYTVTAAPVNSNTGRWDYRVTKGSVLKRSEPGQGNWQDF